MGVRAGTRLGPYLIDAAIGAGGMGEVFRATDTNLGRQVAIKMLPEQLARDSDRLARFDREARTLASLNHPNIAAIYGLERSDGDTALVMELVEGPTLADRIARGRIPVDEARSIGIQIAEALEAAHELGIIHRDLKPANIKVRPDGVVKVLDFGLAKATRSDPGSDIAADTASHSPTLTSPPMTEAGVLLGTAAYMSPEQARGKPVDRRADIWAFGCVLYEMLTACRPFGGDSVSDTLALVLTSDVDWTRLPADLPDWVRHLIARCLEKDPRRRLRDIGEARLALEGPGGLQGLPPPGTTRSRHGMLAAGAIAALIVGSVAGGAVVWRLTRASPPAAVSHTTIVLPAGQQFSFPGRQYVAIAPSGTVVAYSAEPGLWLRQLAEPEARLLPGSEGDVRSPFFSPDSQWVGYYAGGALWRASLTGGAPVRIVDAVNPWGVSWERDGTILYGQGANGIWRVADTGGEGTQVVPATEKSSTGRASCRAASGCSSQVCPLGSASGTRLASSCSHSRLANAPS